MEQHGLVAHFIRNTTLGPYMCFFGAMIFSESTVATLSKKGQNYDDSKEVPLIRIESQLLLGGRHRQRLQLAPSGGSIAASAGDAQAKKKHRSICPQVGPLLVINVTLLNGKNTWVNGVTMTTPFVNLSLVGTRLDVCGG